MTSKLDINNLHFKLTYKFTYKVVEENVPLRRKQGINSILRMKEEGENYNGTHFENHRIGVLVFNF